MIDAILPKASGIRHDYHDFMDSKKNGISVRCRLVVRLMYLLPDGVYAVA